MTTDRIYGIDLGTTYSCLAYVEESSGQPEIVYNTEGQPITPSVVLFEDGAKRVVGQEAKNAAVLDADRVVSMVKRQMGESDWRFTFEGVDHSPEEISSYILRKVADDAAVTLDAAVRDVVITCPAYFGIAERDATAKAGEIAGLNVHEVINEPTAAAIAFGLHDDRDQTVLVYDLGGGTFDVTMIEVKGGSVTVVATGGDHRLGGRDWDQEIVTFLAAAWQRETGSSESPTDSEETLQDLWQRAEAAKQALTSREETKVPVSHDGRRVSVTLSRDQFDQLTAHLLERTVQFTADLIAEAKRLGHERFDQLLLVGGSTRMPQVPKRLASEFGVEPKAHDPDQAVAKGAAIYAQKLAVGQRIRTVIAATLDRPVEEVDTDGVPDSVREQAAEAVAADLGLKVGAVKRLDRMRVVNVTSHSFGIVCDDTSGGERVERIANLVLVQDRLPATPRRQFFTRDDNQADVELRIMQNLKRSPLAELSEGQEIGVAILPLTPGLHANSPIEVTFELAPDGRLQVTGRDLARGGEQVTATIETDRGLSQEEVDEAKSRSRGVTVSG